MTKRTGPLRAATSFTVKQGHYLAFIDHYSRLHGMPPAESDFRAFFKVTPPVVHQMIKTLHARGFIDREPGKARTITLRLGRAQLPDLETHSGPGKPLLNSVAGMSPKRARRDECEPAPGSRDPFAFVGRARPVPGSETRQQADCLDVLTGEEAGAVLHALLKAHPDLRSDARRVANRLLATVSLSEVAEKVCAGLQALELDDLDAGPHGRGYVEPSEAAWDVVEGVVAPYIHDLERRVKLRHEVEAFQVCSGIVAGLYRAEHSGFELHEYAEDAPAELAGHAVGMWRRRRRNRAFPRQFVETFTPDWDWLAD